jgi:hypothetical protein
MAHTCHVCPTYYPPSLGVEADTGQVAKACAV